MDGLAITCEIARLDPRPLPDFAATLGGRWRFEEAPPVVVNGQGEAARYSIRAIPDSAAREETSPRERDESLPRLIRDIETLGFAELPSVVTWPERLGVLVATRFDTLGVDLAFSHHISAVTMELEFASPTASPATVLFRLQKDAAVADEQVGAWGASLAMRSDAVTDDDIASLFAALRTSVG
ncbi:MAG TPA: hypothetical protein VM938_05305 [Acidimicrobiales bacterium]|nr:hypothetical protein [Acidimicrobiales bacterium]